MVKNEKGSSLLAVLLIMSVFTITGLSLMGLTVNNTKQVSKIGNDLQATNLAEMGTSHIKEDIFQLLTKSNIIFDTKFEEDLKDKLKNPIMLKTGSYYQIEINEVTGVPENNVETLTVGFTSTGFSDNQKSISGTLEVTKTIANIFPPTTPVNTNLISDFQKFNQDRDVKIYSNPVYYVDGFEFKSVHGKPLVYSKGLYSKVIDLENKTILSVIGDTHVLNMDPKTNGQECLMCVEGTLHIYGKPPAQEIQLNPSLVCPNNVNNGVLSPGDLTTDTKGIYARNVKYHNEPAKWDKKNIVINAQYE